MAIKLETPLFQIKGVGPKFLERLERLNIKTVKNLLWHFPNRYEDFSETVKIKDLKIRGPGEFLGEQIAQTGMPDLAMKALQNPDLVKISREAAKQLIEEDFDFKKHSLLKQRLENFQKEVHME